MFDKAMFTSLHTWSVAAAIIIEHFYQINDSSIYVGTKVCTRLESGHVIKPLLIFHSAGREKLLSRDFLVNPPDPSYPPGRINCT